jgi:hypothetical protein
MRHEAMKHFVKKASLIGMLICLAVALPAQKSSGNKQAPPAGKHVPQAKTSAEFNDYNTAYALAGGAAS